MWTRMNVGEHAQHSKYPGLSVYQYKTPQKRLRRLFKTQRQSKQGFDQLKFVPQKNETRVKNTCPWI